MTQQNKKPTPLGSWQSTITAASLSQANIRLAEPTIVDNAIYWLEGRPSEQGRSVLVKRDQNGATIDLTPAPFNVRTRAHEYGGGAYTVSEDKVYFVNYSDQAIYTLAHTVEKADADAAANISKVYESKGQRFADLLVDEKRQRLIVIVEDHNVDGEAACSLCSIDLTTQSMQVLAQGADFYSSPTLSADGRQLAWLSWMHPYMPWDQTTLHLAEFDADNQLKNHRSIGNSESIFQPIFGPDDHLYFASDRDNWWNLYRLDQDGSALQITKEQAEIGTPQWVFGMRVFDFINANEIACTRVKNGIYDLCIVDKHSGVSTVCELPYTALEHLSAQNGAVVCLAASPEIDLGIVHVLISSCQTSTLQSSSNQEISADLISVGQTIEYPTSDQQTSHGFFYAPCHPEHCHLDDVLPPLIVLVHGGPTTATDNGLNPRIQFWTSRGFAVLDVNYRGSTGYGRDYRQQLNGKWGVNDVQDCVYGTRYLAEQNLVDPNRLYIMGGSAGGYTVLSALAFTDCFHGGISLYGVGDLQVLMDDTHKFEAKYLIGLVGPLSTELYRARSPLFSADAIQSPVLFFQGSEDKVVPPNQAEMMVAALEKNNIPTQYVVMEGEGHGFRRSDSIETMLETTLSFLYQCAAPQQ